jgi:tripartite-type tricarboxylate transporter receptor subunit TctC
VNVLLRSTIAVLLACTAINASAQAWPTKPIRIIIPFAAGGGTDIQSRTAGRILSGIVGQPMVAENRPGASGIIGLDAFVQSPADGYTLLMFGSTTAVAHHFQNRSFDINKLMVPLGNLTTAPVILVVNPGKINVRTMAELVAYFRANPGTTYTTVGPGSLGHLSMSALAKRLDLNVSHVPYKGGAPAMTDTVAGHVGMMLADLTVAKGPVLSGAVRPIIAVGTQRIVYAPDTPTGKELGFPELQIGSLNGLAIGVGTPAPIVARLLALTKEIAESATYRQVVSESGNFPEHIEGAVWGKMIQDEYEARGKAIRETGFKLE